MMPNKSTDEIRIQLYRDPAYFELRAQQWDALLARSPTDSVFLSAAWFRSWLAAVQQTNLLVFEARINEEPCAGVALQQTSDTIEFAADGFVDYSDFLIDTGLDAPQRQRVFDRLFDAIKENVPAGFHLNLTRIPSKSPTIAAIANVPGAFMTQVACTPAPLMDMSLADKALRKKSLVRHERKLARTGNLECSTVCQADAVLPQLDEFFHQHIKRWNDTPYPSTFLDKERQAFYRELTKELSAAGWLRFATVSLDNELLACHFGFLRNGIFTWYKPTYDTDYAKLSPGEVLLKHLIEQAKTDHAETFDFTIGDEAFKLRFASSINHVVSLHVTFSPVQATIRRARLLAGRAKRKLRQP